MIFLDCAARRSRLTSLLGNAAGIPFVWQPPRDNLIFYIYIWPWLVLFIIHLFSEHPAVHTPPSLSIWGKIAIVVVDSGILLMILASLLFWLRGRTLEAFRLTRGKFVYGVKILSRKTKVFSSQDPPVYVIPDQDFARICPRMGRGIVLPRRLLDQLTRQEIDALVARQLCLQSKQFRYPAIWILLVCNVVVVSIAQWLQAAQLFAFLLYLSLLAVELFALSRSLPRMLFQTDLRAIQLTGDAEAFFSALGGLSRFTGVPPSEPMLLRIGRATGISPERIKELLAEHETKPEDCYPTTGSYMDTGL